MIVSLLISMGKKVWNKLPRHKKHRCLIMSTSDNKVLRMQNIVNARRCLTFVRKTMTYEHFLHYLSACYFLRVSAHNAHHYVSRT